MGGKSARRPGARSAPAAALEPVAGLVRGFRNVRYLLMGGQAMRLAGMPRFSMDWDLQLTSFALRLRMSKILDPLPDVD